MARPAERLRRVAAAAVAPAPDGMSAATHLTPDAALPPIAAMDHAPQVNAPANRWVPPASIAPTAASAAASRVPCAGAAAWALHAVPIPTAAEPRMAAAIRMRVCAVAFR